VTPASLTSTVQLGTQRTRTLMRPDSSRNFGDISALICAQREKRKGDQRNRKNVQKGQNDNSSPLHVHLDCRGHSGLRGFPSRNTTLCPVSTPVWKPVILDWVRDLILRRNVLCCITFQHSCRKCLLNPFVLTLFHHQQQLSTQFF
jgi:hypothetical protein